MTEPAPNFSKGESRRELSVLGLLSNAAPPSTVNKKPKIEPDIMPTV